MNRKVKDFIRDERGRGISRRGQVVGVMSEFHVSERTAQEYVRAVLGPAKKPTVGKKSGTPFGDTGRAVADVVDAAIGKVRRLIVSHLTNELSPLL